MSEVEPVIELKEAVISHDDHLVLSEVNFTLNKAEFVYLIGKVGSGKSSLIKTINAEIPLQKGTGIVAGFLLHRLKKRQIPFLRRKLGIVFQDFQLLIDRNVYQNLAFVLKATGWKNKKEADRRINAVLDMVGLSTKGYKMPHQLSGGEQQRVVIARALLNNPDIILADEPTGNLDPDTSSEIVQLLHEISANGCAVIMATHNYTFLKKFPARIVRCENSKLIDLGGTVQEIDFETLMM
ncbi:MAG: ATP-binding cassette domain-containing protein [Bacteroidales bacterium]|nr:ATP-binding cassette domain-containing protein [Bacteroidales bacterium]